MHGATKVNLL